MVDHLEAVMTESQPFAVSCLCDSVGDGDDDDDDDDDEEEEEEEEEEDNAHTNAFLA